MGRGARATAAHILVMAARSDRRTPFGAPTTGGATGRTYLGERIAGFARGGGAA